MKIAEFLQKIGISRFGGAAETRSNAKDAPDGLMTEVYKPKVDSTGKEDPDGQST